MLRPLQIRIQQASHGDVVSSLDVQSGAAIDHLACSQLLVVGSAKALLLSLQPVTRQNSFETLNSYVTCHQHAHPTAHPCNAWADANPLAHSCNAWADPTQNCISREPQDKGLLCALGVKHRLERFDKISTGRVISQHIPVPGVGVQVVDCVSSSALLHKLQSSHQKNLAGIWRDNKVTSGHECCDGASADRLHLP